MGKIKDAIKQWAFSNKFKFYTYNLFLPLMIPCFILIMSQIFFNNGKVESILQLLLQTMSLYLVVTLFTNIGFWSFENTKASTSQDNKERQLPNKDKETHIAISTNLGVLSVFIFVCSYIVTDFVIVVLSLIFTFIVLFISLKLYYLNPLVMYSGPNEITPQNERDKIDTGIAKGMGGKLL